MSAGKSSAAAALRASERNRSMIRCAFAVVNTLSFIAMIWRFWYIASSSSNDVPFHWVMLSYVLGGCVLPLTLIGCIALIHSLFWENDDSR